MKKIITTVLLSFFTLISYADQVKSEPPKTKQVCKDVIGKNGKAVKNKDGSVKQACRTIKIHKKLEGTKVPVKK
jgi:hypothetical protein